MDYVLDYEVCALILLVVITVRFFSVKKFNNRADNVFGAILFCAILNVILDILGSLIVVNINKVPQSITIGVNTVFYMMQAALPALMLFYVMTLSGRKFSKIIYFLFIPMLFCELVLFSNPWTKTVFYLQNTADGLLYEHGSMFYMLYIGTFLYLFLSVCLIFKLRSCFDKSERLVIFLNSSIIIFALIIQYFHSQYLLTGLAMTISILLMYFTMQNTESMVDVISGAFNYSALTEYLHMQITGEKQIWVTAVDVGGLRRVNSDLGIRTGNELLRHVGDFFNSQCGYHCKTFRMISTRFIIVSDNREKHLKVVGLITERFKQPWLYEKKNIDLIATIRYFEKKNELVTPEAILNIIDLAYANASEDGFGTSRPIDGERLSQFRRKELIKKRLSSSLDNGKGLYLNFQPLFSVEQQDFVGVEVLLRFRDAALGEISPAEFIPIAENSELIRKIDAFVVKKSCDFIKSNRKLFDSRLKVIEINLSAAEFNTDISVILDEISDNIRNIENLICFEVTETVATTRTEILQNFMNRLICRGVRFAVDDFGTGYANITRLAKLPFSIVKLDKMFVTQNNLKEKVMTADLVKMFSNIGLSTVMEGVETAEQAEFAAEIGIKQIQGYYYSRPLSEEQLINLLSPAEEQHDTKQSIYVSPVADIATI